MRRTGKKTKRQGLKSNAEQKYPEKLSENGFGKSRRFVWRSRKRIHRQAKDRLFRFLFEKDREALLQLYNALNGTDYRDASLLKVVTIESAVYIVMKNDLAFVLAGTLSLYEHQSTYNPNMPVRFLIYLAKEYQKLIEQAQESIYGTKQMMLPMPQCVVFYNGTKMKTDEEILRLSDSFMNQKQGAEADVELKVRMLNINHGHNAVLMNQCRVLREYALFVEISRRRLAEGTEPKEALEAAVFECIEQDILAGFLKKYRAEVLGMLLEEFDVKKYERSLKAEGREEGREEESGRYCKLIALLFEQHREAELKSAAEDPEYRERLFQEFRL